MLRALPLLVLCACGASSSGAGLAGDPPTWSRDIAPLLEANCLSCHQEGGIAPFSMETYEQVRDVAPAVRSMTETRQMPPFNPDASGACNTFRDARWLTDAQIAAIGAWVEAGAPEGEPGVRLAPRPVQGLTSASVVLDTGVDYLPQAGLSDDYRCFVIDPGLAQDGFVTAFDVRPGDARVVHHVIVYEPDSVSAAEQARALDDAEEGTGYTCFGGPNVAASLLAGWAPGGGVTRFPEGTGLAIAADRPVVVQIHYNTLNGSYPDRTRVDLAVAEAVSTRALVFPIAALGLYLPPGEPQAQATASFGLPGFLGSVQVWGVFPHMHTLGRSLRVHAGETCLVDVPRWDFHWQGFAFYDTPLTVRGGEEVSITCVYDTRDRTSVTTWGEKTTDEMCLNYVYVSL